MNPRTPQVGDTVRYFTPLNFPLEGKVVAASRGFLSIRGEGTSFAVRHRDEVELLPRPRVGDRVEFAWGGANMIGTVTAIDPEMDKHGVSVQIDVNGMEYARTFSEVRVIEQKPTDRVGPHRRGLREGDPVKAVGPTHLRGQKGRITAFSKSGSAAFVRFDSGDQRLVPLADLVRSVRPPNERLDPIARSPETQGHGGRQHKYAAPLARNLRIGMVCQSYGEAEKEVSFPLSRAEAKWLREQINEFLESD